MTKLLRIDASSRHDGSFSRRLGDALVERLAPQKLTVLDLAKDPVPHLSEDSIGAFFSDPSGWTETQRQSVALSDRLLEQLTEADTLLLTVPMYNFGIPSALKAWIDQIVRIGKSFSFDGKSFSGLMTGKRAYLVVAYGAAGYVDGDFKIADYVAPYLKFLLGFIGIADVTVIPVEGVNVGMAEQAESQAKELVAKINLS